MACAMMRSISRLSASTCLRLVSSQPVGALLFGAQVRQLLRAGGPDVFGLLLQGGQPREVLLERRARLL